jgi:hypothetical protein
LWHWIEAQKLSFGSANSFEAPKLLNFHIMVSMEIGWFTLVIFQIGHFQMWWMRKGTISSLIFNQIFLSKSQSCEKSVLSFFACLNCHPSPTHFCLTSLTACFVSPWVHPSIDLGTGTNKDVLLKLYETY